MGFKKRQISGTKLIGDKNRSAVDQNIQIGKSFKYLRHQFKSLGFIPQVTAKKFAAHSCFINSLGR